MGDIVERPEFIGSYKENMKTYLKIAHPDVDDKEIDRFLREKVLSRLKQPYVTVVDSPSAGTMDLKTMKLGECINRINNKVVLPMGSVYVPQNVEEGFLKGPIVLDKKNRKKSKNLMFKYENEGNTELSDYYKFDQNAQKISMNSKPGAMGSKSSFISDKAGFNSITSTGRYLLASCFSLTERILEGNFYFPTEEMLINHLVLLKKHCPSRESIEKVLSKYQMKEVWGDDLTYFLSFNYQKYNDSKLSNDTKKWLENSPHHYQSFVYYHMNLRNIFRTGMMYEAKEKLEKFYVREDNSTGNPEVFDKMNGDQILLLTIFYYELFVDENGKQLSLSEVRQKYKDREKILAYKAQVILDAIDYFHDLFEVFMTPEIVVSRALIHPFMLRDTVLGSDTDSLLFTNKEWLKWYTGKYILSTEGLFINALFVYFLSITIAKYLYLLSSQLGAVDEGRTIMNMKNEFTFPVMVLTNLKKHYLALRKVQEGLVFPVPKKEIKGVQFKGSSLTKSTLDTVEEMILDTLNVIVNDSKIDFESIIKKTIDFELSIKDNVEGGSITYYPVIPIKPREEYKEDSCIHENFEVWRDVFGDKYGHIPYFSKCALIPLNKCNIGELKKVRDTSPDIYDKWIEVLTDWTKRKKRLTRIPINPELTTVPSEILPFVNTTKLIDANVKPIYLFLRSFGITSGGTMDHPVFFHEIYSNEKDIDK